MPQITKVRIVNFQYNDGKRLIADELYDFEQGDKGPADVLINLANGGGKSVLVQLIMQPVIPRAKVAGRRIESFFTRASDHCYVVLEWALNSSRRLMTGIAISASDAAVDPDADRGFQIKYYTFLSAYQDYQGLYNIRELPLSRKENGKFVPAAFDDVRVLARRSGGELTRYASDDGVNWRNRLAEYGIFQNEWRMIEELNSNEDGLSKYFSSLKSSDAVIDRLIVPRIEEKQRRSVSRDDSSLETMLISYARQFSRQRDIIREREVCAGFCTALEEAKAGTEALWERNDAFEKSVGRLFGFSDALGAELRRLAEEQARLKEETGALAEQTRHIRWEEISADYYTRKTDFETADGQHRAAETERTAAKDRLDEATNRRKRLESARYYGRLKEAESRIDALRGEIAARESGAETGGELARLKYSAYSAIVSERNRTGPLAAQLREELAGGETALERLDGELSGLQRKLDQANADLGGAQKLLDRQIGDDDELAGELGIAAFRMLDGRFPENDLNAWQEQTLRTKTETEETLRTVREDIAAMERQREELPLRI